MAKAKLAYVCQSCGSVHPKWSGQCADCESWNSLLEQAGDELRAAKKTGYSGQRSEEAVNLNEIELVADQRTSSGVQEFDRVLGGGIVAGSAVLIGGDPGIGKSTILLQILGTISSTLSVLYITGEESLQQVAMRAKRLGLPQTEIKALSETCVEDMLAVAKRQKPKVLVVDSIQTTHTEDLNSAAGSVSQIRECATKLVQYAKTNNVALFMVGHVTKEGALAGPRVLEHIVDTVLYFEGQTDNRFRLIRAVKNRFGAVNELGIFAMTDKGLKEVSNPSAIFLSHQGKARSGSVVMTSWEGSRPMLVEVQSLVDASALGNPRRVAVGIDANRLTICLAVLNRHGGVQTGDQDVFINVVGGVRVTETASDLALIFAVLSSLRDRPIPNDLIVFGEVGLSGEIRPVQGGVERLREAEKHGFRRAVVPEANAKHAKLSEMKVKGIQHLQDAIDYFNEL